MVRMYWRRGVGGVSDNRKRTPPYRRQPEISQFARLARRCCEDSPRTEVSTRVPPLVRRLEFDQRRRRRSGENPDVGAGHGHISAGARQGPWRPAGDLRSQALGGGGNGREVGALSDPRTTEPLSAAIGRITPTHITSLHRKMGEASDPPPSFKMRAVVAKRDPESNLRDDSRP